MHRTSSVQDARQHVVAYSDWSRMTQHVSMQFVNVIDSWDPQNHTWELTEALRPSVVNLNWQRSGKTVFKSVNFAGYIGILTAVKPV